MKKYLILMLFILFAGCSAKNTSVAMKHNKSYSKYHSFIISAESRATPAARKVMTSIRHMVESREIIRGACWDYLNLGFTRAGYPHAKRTIAYKSKKSGPYVSVDRIQTGDWLYHINHSYHGIEHSGMFIGWIDYSRKIGLTLSYAGEGRAEPARYKTYNLSSVYHIMRAE